MSITATEIAMLAEVSQPVVSTVLNGSRSTLRVSDATRRRVTELARRYQYRPHAGARAMRQGRFRCAALLQSMNPGWSYLPMDLLNGIHDALTARGMHLTYTRIPDDRLVNEGFVPRILRELYADGLLINYNAFIPPVLVDLIRRYDIPAVWLNSRQETDAVYPDDQDGAQQATEHLLSLGHRRIGFLNVAGPGHYSAQDRRGGYEQAMRRAGLTPASTVVEAHGEEDRMQAARRLLSGPPPVTAVVAYSPQAVEALRRSAAERGLRVPGDVAVVGFDTAPLRVDGVTVPTMLLPERRMGEAAVDMLMLRIEHPGIAQPALAVPCDFQAE